MTMRGSRRQWLVRALSSQGSPKLTEARRRVHAAIDAALAPAQYRPPELWPNDDAHPERLAVLPHVRGICVEIGCGYRKTLPGIVGIDMVPGGQPGTVGNVSQRTSQADIAALGDKLPLPAKSVDTLLARHNLEHYIDLVGVLQEWHRVLKPWGRMVVIVPDEEHYPGSTVGLDPTHYHAFSRVALSRLVELTGFRVVETKTVVSQWSFMLVADRRAGTMLPQ